MAFNTNAAAPQAVANQAWEKASGFINIYLPSKDGKRRKVGAIPLRASKANEKQMLDFLDEDEGNITKLSAKLIVEYQSAAVTEAHSLDL
jgi:hypothetical protein